MGWRTAANSLKSLEAAAVAAAARCERRCLCLELSRQLVPALTQHRATALLGGSPSRPTPGASGGTYYAYAPIEATRVTGRGQKMKML